jgi:5-(aminomethyl)-3-furanmethanol phosphate kinase
VALTVLKVGGSLSSEPAKLRALIAKLDTLSKTNRLVVVPGGGEFADTVRKYDNLYSLDGHISHRMAILAMDQYGLLLSNLSSTAVIVRSFAQAVAAAGSGKLPIFLPAQVLFAEDPLENSWEVTSDSIALYIAHTLHAEKVLFVTNVDGIYTDNPKNGKPATLINEISPNALEARNMRTSVDSALAGLLKKWPIQGYVVNGFYPERVEMLLEDRTAIATLISDKQL